MTESEAGGPPTEAATLRMTTEARDWLDGVVRRVMARHHLGEPERAGVHYELMSHLHSGAEAKARKAGRDEIVVGDIQAAVLDAGGEARLAQAFVAPLEQPLRTAGFWRRLAAYVIDVVALNMALSVVWGIIALAFFPLWFFTGGPPANPWDGGYWMDGWGPFAFGTGLAGASLVATIAYFTVLEGLYGQTLGKKLLDVRVATTQGRPLNWESAILRNVVKGFPFFLFLDTLAMVFVFEETHQRASDRVANTLVVATR